MLERMRQFTALINYKIKKRPNKFCTVVSEVSFFVGNPFKVNLNLKVITEEFISNLFGN